jgi:hypothetical protein
MELEMELEEAMAFNSSSYTYHNSYKLDLLNPNSLNRNRSSPLLGYLSLGKTKIHV